MNAVSGEICAEKKTTNMTKAGYFPQLSLKYFSLSLALLLVFSFVLDRLIIPALEDSGKIVSHSWDEEDQFIYYWAHAETKRNSSTIRFGAAKIGPSAKSRLKATASSLLATLSCGVTATTI